MATSWGGVRVGSGRKRHPVDVGQPLLEGCALVPATVSTTLMGKARAVWEELAPHALAERTLTPRTAAAFELLCRQVVLERRWSSGSERGKADHRALMVRVEMGLQRFCLAPVGRPVSVPTAANPFDAFVRQPDDAA